MDQLINNSVLELNVRQNETIFSSAQLNYDDERETFVFSPSNFYFRILFHVDFLAMHGNNTENKMCEWLSESVSRDVCARPIVKAWIDRWILDTHIFTIHMSMCDSFRIIFFMEKSSAEKIHFDLS